MKTASIITCILLLLASFFLYLFLSKDKTTEVSTVIYRDTVTKLVTAKPMIITKFKPKIIYLKDTLISSKPFIARVDTVILKDTLKTSYTFPENLFSLELKRHPDTLRIEKIILQPKTEIKAWWEKPLYFTAGLCSGILLMTLKASK